MKIMFSGGGTGGSVMPLIAIYQYLSQQSNKFDYFWIGGYIGVEKNILAEFDDIKYQSIYSGKLRRYFSLKNFLDLIKIIIGFFQSLFFLFKIKPEIIITAGSFISVSVVWAGAILRIPIIVHQQDLQPGLANKLMAPFAKQITVSWPESLKDYSAKKTVYTGNPIRQEFFADTSVKIKELKNKYNIKENLPIILVIGGGTGAAAINELVELNIKKLVALGYVFHLSGKDKKINLSKNFLNQERYQQFEFVDVELVDFMKMSDLVITRAGMSTLSELAVLGKAIIIVPIPQSHQEKNAEIFCKNKAAICYQPADLSNDDFFVLIKELLNNTNKLTELKFNITKLMPIAGAVKIGQMINLLSRNFGLARNLNF